MEKLSQLKYERPDINLLKSELDGKTNLFRSAKSYPEARKAFFDINTTLSAFDTMLSLCYIRYTADTSDAFYDSELQAIESEAAELTPQLKTYCEAFVNSPYKNDFEIEFGSQLIQLKEAELKLQNPEIVPLLIEENEISNEYRKTVAGCTCDFLGENCNFYGLLRHMQSTDRNIRRGAFEKWASLYQNVSEKLDECFDKLLKNRIETAHICDFSSYTELAYLGKKRFDWNSADASSFRKQIREVITPFCSKMFEKQRERLGIDKLHIYDEKLIYPEGNPTPTGTKDEMISRAGKMYNELSPETGEFFNYMMEYELFDLETRPNKHLGGYCTGLADFKAPFIFSNFNGTSADVDVLTHEAGHAFEYYIALRSQPIPEYIGSSSEINEIHSMAMEFFTHPWMELFFSENADKYRAAHLFDSIVMVTYIACVDEFQHYIYKNPETNAAGRREVWRKIEKNYMPWRDYDSNAFLESGGYWMQKQHIFLYPFYYIDYAIAQVCVYQLFYKMITSPKTAWKDYLNLCNASGSAGFLELLKKANLKSPFEEGCVSETMSVIFDYLDKLL